MDNAYLGRERSGKRGRGSRNKFPFITAVEATEDGKPVQIHLRRVAGFRTKEISQYAKASIDPDSHVFTDGLACFNGLVDAGCEHIEFILSEDENLLSAKA